MARFEVAVRNSLSLLWPRTRSSGSATIAARLLFMAQPKLEEAPRLIGDSALFDQSGQPGTDAVVRRTTSRTLPSGAEPAAAELS